MARKSGGTITPPKANPFPKVATQPKPAAVRRIPKGRQPRQPLASLGGLLGPGANKGSY